MQKLKTLILRAIDIQEIINMVGLNQIMDDLIHKTYEAFLNYDYAKTKMHARSGFNYMEPFEGLVEWMPLRDVEEGEVLMKLVAYHPNNPKEQNLPTIISTFSKYDTSNGHLKILMDGVLPTALRTGAASAIASRLFGKEDSTKLGLIGCGAQAVTQLHAISRVFDIQKVFIYDVDQSTMQSFAERISMLELNIQIEHSNIKEIVNSSDIITTATSIGIGEGPLFEDIAFLPWVHINAVGSDFPGKIELPKVLLEQAYVSPDFLEQALVEGECQQIHQDQIGNDLIKCIKEANALGHLKDMPTVFDSTGIALEDQIVASLFIDYASKFGVGKYIQLEGTGSDEKNPYAFALKLKH